MEREKVALENDLCACKCPTPPKLIPNQILRFQNLAAQGEIASFDAKASSAVMASLDIFFDDKFILLDADTDAPLAHTEYALKRENGKFEFGVTDEKGHTHLLTATAESESVDIYL